MGPEVVDFLAKADEEFALTQRERIALGLVAQHESVTALQMAGLLELPDADALRPWLGRLTHLGLVKTRGRTKGTEYLIDPELLRRLDFRGLTSLRGIEKHRLRELILRDLGIYAEASMSQTHRRIGPEIPLWRLRRALRELCAEGVVLCRGERRWRRYLLAKIGGNNRAMVNRTGQ